MKGSRFGLPINGLISSAKAKLGPHREPPLLTTCKTASLILIFSSGAVFSQKNSHFGPWGCQTMICMDLLLPFELGGICWKKCVRCCSVGCYAVRIIFFPQEREPLVGSSERQRRAFGFHVVARRSQEKIFWVFFSEMGARSNTVVFEGTGKYSCEPESVRGGDVKLQ